MRFSRSRFLRILKIAVRLGYIFISLWVVGALVFAVTVERSVKYFSKALWLLLICLMGNIPDVLVSDVNGFLGRAIVFVFSILGLILVSVLIGNIASFAIESLLRSNGPVQKSRTKIHLNDHIVFIGWNDEALSILQEIRSSDFVEEIPIVIITNKEIGDYRYVLSRFSNIYWVSGSPFSISNWEKADLQFARSIYLSFEGRGSEITRPNDNIKAKYFNSLNKVLCRYLDVTNSGAFVVISARNDKDISGDNRISVIREESYSDDIISSTVISPRFAKVVNSMVMHSAKSEIYIYSNSSTIKNSSKKLKELPLKKFSEYLLKYNIDLIGFLKTSSDDGSTIKEGFNKLPHKIHYVGLLCKGGHSSAYKEKIFVDKRDRFILLARSEKDIKSAMG